MRMRAYADRTQASIDAAERAGSHLRDALHRHGRANLVLAASLAQISVLAHLRTIAGLDWARVTVFHLDEFVDLPRTHRASCRKIVRDHFVDHVPSLHAFIPVDGDTGHPERERARLNAALDGEPVDVCLAGIGENGHLAFNEPPADFATRDPFIQVAIDDVSRRQLVEEGWFAQMCEVPERALTMSIFQIMRAERIILAVFGPTKCTALREVIAGPLSEGCPASILRLHPSCELFADYAATGGERDWFGYASRVGPVAPGALGRAAESLERPHWPVERVDHEAGPDC